MPRDCPALLRMAFETILSGSDLNPDHPDMEALHQWLLREINDSVLFNRYNAHLARGARGLDNRLREPWHAQGERLFAATVMLGAGRLDYPISVLRDSHTRPVEPSVARQIGLTYAVATLGAHVYLWRSDIEETAAQMPVPRHIISRTALPHDIMFWSRESSMGNHREPDLETNWILLWRRQDHLVAMSDAERHEPLHVELRDGAIRFGKCYPDDFDDEREQYAVGQTLARLAFLASPFIAATPEQSPRPLRRPVDLAAAPSHEHDRCTSVVTLRRIASTPHADPHSDPTGHSWQHQWWVSGHIRAQWYPSEHAHHLIYVAPYIKGPPSAPLLEKTYAVVR